MDAPAAAMVSAVASYQARDVDVRPAAEACGTATDAVNSAAAPRTTRAGRVLVELT
ncbi:hypothetical protein AB0N17_22380 [Streptomyces sp. NPDC051133]|uniref:hypothetical protein n=1 Tax=Streptomyces sp. NPDC051133 TaxID=3155521 RepID=UPI0034416401